MQSLGTTRSVVPSQGMRLGEASWGGVWCQVLYLTLTSWLDKRTENADRERLAQAEKDRRVLRSRMLCVYKALAV